jgi:hypothetical protein
LCLKGIRFVSYLILCSRSTNAQWWNMFIIYYLLPIRELTKLQLCALHLRTNPLPPAVATGHTTCTVGLTVRYANVGLFWGNLAMFHTYITYVYKYGVQSVVYPKHRSCHGTPPRKQTSYATELPCSGRDKRDTLYIHKHTRAQTVEILF